MKISKNFDKIRNNSFLKKSIVTLFLRISGAFVLFGFTVFLTKSFSPKIVGQYDFARTFLLVVGSICLLGFDQSILYFKGILTSKKSLAELKNIYYKMVLMLFLASVTALIIILIIDKKVINNYFSDNEVYPIILKSTIALFFSGLSMLNTEIFRALDKLIVAELFRNIIKYVPLVLGAIVLFYYQKETYLVDVFLIGFVVLAVMSSIFVFFYFKKIKQSSTENISHKEIFLKSYPIAISGMALFLLMSFDILFLKKYHNDETVAFYSVGVKIMTILSIIIVTINITISAKISEYFSGHKTEELAKVLKNSSRTIFSITFPVIVLLSVFSDYILSFFGDGYIAAKQAFLILIIGQGISSAFGSSSVYLNMTGRQHIYQIILIIAVIINFVLNRFLIPLYGMTGAAIAFVSSTFFWNFVSAVIIYRKDKMKVFLN